MELEVNDILKRLETRTRQLILSYRNQQDEIAKLQEKLQEQTKYAKALEEENQKLRTDYSRLKAARLMDMADDDDLHETRKRINRMIASVDRCIATIKA
jgi:septal ring factor EnvC (AmiA/AmiB activator)